MEYENKLCEAEANKKRLADNVAEMQFKYEQKPMPEDAPPSLQGLTFTSSGEERQSRSSDASLESSGHIRGSNESSLSPPARLCRCQQSSKWTFELVAALFCQGGFKAIADAHNNQTR